MSFNSSTDLPALSGPRRRRSLWRRVNELEDQVSGGAGIMGSATVTLDRADMLALHTTPVELLPAVAGKAYLPLGLLLKVDWGAGLVTAFTGNMDVRVVSDHADRNTSLFLLADSHFNNYFSVDTDDPPHFDYPGPGNSLTAPLAGVAKEMYGKNIEVANNGDPMEDGNEDFTLRVTYYYLVDEEA